MKTLKVTVEVWKELKLLALDEEISIGNLIGKLLVTYKGKDNG